jgi:hypothetical protein
MRGLRRAVALLLVSALVMAACQGTLKSSAPPTSTAEVASVCMGIPGAVSWQQILADHSPLTPRPALLSVTGNPPHHAQINLNIIAGGTYYLHTFSVSPPSPPLAGRLSFTARPFSNPFSQDDLAKIYSGTSPALLHQFYLGTTGSTVGAMPNSWLPSNYPFFQYFSYTFTSSQLATMFISGTLDVQIGQDSQVSTIALELCLPQPTPTPTPTVIPTAGVATVTGPATALDIEPSPTPTVVKQGTVVSIVTPVPLPTPTPTVVKQATIVPVVTPVPLPTPTATPTPSPVPTKTVGTLVGTVVPLPTPTPTSPPTPTPTPTPTATPSGNCDLAVSKQIEPTGTPGVYHVSITVQNIGSGPCPAGAVLSDPAPTGMSFSGPLTITEPGASGNWSCSGMTCTAGNALPSGYAGTFGFTATTHQPPVTNCARIVSAADVATGNNSSCAQAT